MIEQYPGALVVVCRDEKPRLATVRELKRRYGGDYVVIACVTADEVPVALAITHVHAHLASLRVPAPH